MSTLLLLHGFNNYYNRIRKPYPTEGYKAAVGEGNWREYFNINFFPNDGVSTTQTINFNTDDLGFDADYLVVFDDASTTENPIVKSRWFVIEQIRNRQKQLKLTLRRDLLIDYADEIDSATVFVEKGAVNYSTSNTDPAFYLEEDMVTNQRLQSMEYIKRTSDTSTYFVAFIAADGNEYKVGFGDETTPGIDYFTLPASRPSQGSEPYTIYFWESVGLGGYLAALIARSLAGSGVLYDIIKFPYQPAHTVDDYDIQTLSGMPTMKKASSANIEFIYAATQSSLFTVNNRIQAKIANQTVKARICSPGEASAFEFTPFKNAMTGQHVSLTVRCTLKPINPYIHILPTNFGGQYGDRNGTVQAISKDPRGLIVSADYSCALVNDQWQTYQINNKNYLNMFNRQVESLELQNKWGLITDIASAASGTISGAVGGAALGGGVGAVVGGLGAAITGTIGVLGNEELRADALDLTKDQFGYQLGNIQAMPNLLLKTSAFVIDSQVYPYLAIYRATPTEETALENKIKYNGMKIMRIGTFSSYRQNLGSDIRYMKCKLIRINIKEDYHIVSEIGRELDKGFFGS